MTATADARAARDALDATSGDPVACPICDRVASADRHPCAFARACRCWRGIPCTPRTPRKSRSPEDIAR